MKNSTKAFVAVVVVGAAGAGLITWAATRNSSSGSSAKVPVSLTTAKVTVQDLVTYNTTTATLGFVTSSTISSPIDGTITTIDKTGDTVDAGSVVGTIDGAPVVALIGDVPPFRDLALGVTDGIDVLQLKQNLVMLGYANDGSIAIDEHYDSATVAAVDRWEAALGVTQDGKVPKSRVVFIPGKLLVDTVSAQVGSHVAAGAAMLVGRVAERKVLVPATIGSHGTVAKFAAVGSDIVDGTELFTVSGRPVIALEGDAAALPVLERDLSVGVTDGADVKLLEQYLVAGGFDPNKQIVVDDHFDANTAASVAMWQTKLESPADGVVPKGSFVVVPPGLIMGKALVADGGSIAADSVVATLSAPAREVSTTAPVGDTTFVLGAKIDVLFPDGTTKTGTVVNVGTVATASSNTPGSTPNVPITIRVDDIPKSVDSFVQIPVTLQVVQDSTKGAFVVPVSALVALAEGGYSLEVVDAKNADGTFKSHLVKVTPGLYSDGFVAVTGDKVSDGLEVVVPS